MSNDFITSCCNETHSLIPTAWQKSDRSESVTQFICQSCMRYFEATALVYRDMKLRERDNERHQE